MANARLLAKQEKLSLRIVELEDQLARKPVPLPRSPLQRIYLAKKIIKKKY